MGIWRLICPKGGEYKGECKYTYNPKEGFDLKCASGLDVLKAPKDGSCDDTRSECIKKMEMECCGGHGVPRSKCKCNPEIECSKVHALQFGASNVAEIASIDYKAGRKEIAVSEVDLNGDIEVHLNPKLKKHPKEREAVVKHELEEGVCVYNTTMDCHDKAVSHEPEWLRSSLKELGIP